MLFKGTLIYFTRSEQDFMRSKIKIQKHTIQFFSVLKYMKTTYALPEGNMQ